MGDAMQGYRMHAWVAENDFQPRPRRRIAGAHGFDSFNPASRHVQHDSGVNSV
ncbi:hypothetical protein [Elioraea tepidiphila]|uniref:hypothetical protein n=1 Tax=Elioraea tepidiphila TaxID=457934 RepID=UPI002FDB6DB8